MKITDPKEMHTLEAITFTAELTNSLNQPIDGNISWKAIPIGVPYVGGFDDNTSTFYARREGEVAIVALAKPIDNCNSSDDITDTVRVKVTADCTNKPLQPDCHSTWEGTVQIKAELFQECYSNSMFVCNNYCRSRGFFTYNLTLTLEFEINATDSRNVGKLNVTGTETLESIVWDNWNQTCVSSSQIEPINETDNLYIPIDIYKVDPITHFLPSYNDFDSFLGGYDSNFTNPWPFNVVGTINGNSGSLTITSYNVIDNGDGVDVTETPVKTEVVLTRISK